MAGLPRDRIVAANEEFHDAVIAAAGNERLAQAIRQTRAYYFNYRIAAVYSGTEVTDAFAAHRRIADAVRRRDADAAEQLTRRHVGEALELAVHKL
jgi:GntR family transcriptional repressor for pyruvate dehydrogenase complex